MIAQDFIYLLAEIDEKDKKNSAETFENEAFREKTRY